MKIYTHAYARKPDELVSVSDAVTTALVNSCHASGPSPFEQAVASALGTLTQALYDNGHLDSGAVTHLLDGYFRVEG